MFFVIVVCVNVMDYVVVLMVRFLGKSFQKWYSLQFLVQNLAFFNFDYFQLEHTIQTTPHFMSFKVFFTAINPTDPLWQAYIFTVEKQKKMH